MSINLLKGFTIQEMCKRLASFEKRALAEDIARKAAPLCTAAYREWFAAKQTPYEVAWTPNPGHTNVPDMVDSGRTRDAEFVAVGTKLRMTVPRYTNLHARRQRVQPSSAMGIPPALEDILDKISDEVCAEVMDGRSA